MPKGKEAGYYQETKQRLGYVSSPPQFDSDSKFVKTIYHDHSSDTSLGESDVSIKAIFKGLSISMVTTSHQNNLEDNVTTTCLKMIMTPRSAS